MVKSKLRKYLKQIWHFLWEENSVWSWIANIALAFILIKFVVYPGIGLILGTNYPIVAVVSGSMEHSEKFENWFASQNELYASYSINEAEFQNYLFRNGFNKGDIIILRGIKPHEINVGDVIVFRTSRPDPIIHRVVEIYEENGSFYYHTKGDNNRGSLLDETRIPQQNVIGKAYYKIPWLGWIKIGFASFIESVMGR